MSVVYDWSIIRIKFYLILIMDDYPNIACYVLFSPKQFGCTFPEKFFRFWRHDSLFLLGPYFFQVFFLGDWIIGKNMYYPNVSKVLHRCTHVGVQNFCAPFNPQCKKAGWYDISVCVSVCLSVSSMLLNERTDFDAALFCLKASIIEMVFSYNVWGSFRCYISKTW